MNQDQLQGKFDQLKGKVRETWGRLTDNDIDLINGKREQFLGRLQEVYGLTKEDAHKRFSTIVEACNSSQKTE